MLEYEPTPDLLAPANMGERDFLDRAKRFCTDRSLDQIQGFDILEKIGQGGFATVYLARQRSLDRLVALKISPVSPGTNRQARFRQETDILAKLHHPHVVTVHESGSVNGQDYYALEYCPGGSLAERIAGHVLLPLTAARLMQQIARTMADIHRQEIVHRDLKPSNLLIANSQEASWDKLHIKIADFGLARTDVGSDHTQTGDSLGTPQYVAPEQLSDSKNARKQADIYSLGAVLYELITGRPPFLAATLAEVIVQVRLAELVSPRKLVPQIPADLETICLKCLEKEPRDRYASMDKLADDLERFCSGDPIHARPLTRPQLIWRWCCKHPGIASLTTASGLLMILLSLLGFSFWKQSLVADQQRELSTGQTYLRVLTDIRNHQIKRKNGWRSENLEALRQLSQMETSLRDVNELRNEAAATLLGYDLGKSQVYQSTLGQAYCLAGHPNQSLLAIGYSKAVDNQSTNVIEYLDPTTNVVKYSLKWPAHRGPFGDQIKKDWDGIRSLAFSPDGKYLYIGTRSGRLFRYLEHAQQSPELIHTFPEGVCSITCSPDGHKLYLQSNFLPYRSTLWQLDLRHPSEARIWHAPSSIGSFTLSQVGSYFVCSTNATLEVVATSDFQTTASLKIAGGRSCCSPYSNLMAVLTYDTPIAQLEKTQDVQNPNRFGHQLILLEGSSLKTIRSIPLSTDNKEESLISFLPDGIHLALFWQATNRLMVFDMASGDQVATVDLHDSHWPMVVLPTTNQLAIPTGNGATIFTPSHSIFKTTALNDRNLSDADLSKDGTTLATLDEYYAKRWTVNSDSELSIREVLKVKAGGDGGGKRATKPFICLSFSGSTTAWYHPYSCKLEENRSRNPVESHEQILPELLHARFSSKDILIGIVGNSIDDVSFNPERPKSLWKFPDSGMERVYELSAFTIGKKDIAVTSRDNHVTVLTPESNSTLRETAQWRIVDDDIVGLEICKDDSQIVVATKSGRLELRDSSTGTLLDRFPEMLRGISSIDVSRNGLLAVACVDGSVNVFELSRNRFRALLNLQFRNAIKKLRISDDGHSLMVLIAGDHVARLLNLEQLSHALNDLQLAW